MVGPIALTPATPANGGVVRAERLSTRQAYGTWSARFLGLALAQAPLPPNG
jgi:hypothetical protein